MKKERSRDNLRPEYEFSKGVRGKYAKQYARGTNLVRIAPDVRDVFPDAKSVNEALRAMARIVRSQTERSAPGTK